MMKLWQEHNRTFINWFRQTIFVDDNASNTLRLLVVGPKGSLYVIRKRYEGLSFVNKKIVS